MKHVVKIPLHVKLCSLGRRTFKELVAPVTCPVCGRAMRISKWVHVERPDGLSDQWYLCSRCIKDHTAAELRDILYCDTDSQ